MITGPPAVARIDPFPFQHRVGELMASDVPVLAPSATLAAAAQIMAERGFSAVMVLDSTGRPAGIVTEHDILKRIAASGAEALALPLAAVMSAPVTSIPADSFVYAAIARMDRLRYRHLAIVHPETGAFVGLLDTRAILRQRAAVALGIGDQVAVATGPQELAEAFARMPELARSLRAEGVAAHQAAAVISGIMRDITERAAGIAATQMEAHDRGKAPAGWCLLLLGSCGRGESLLSADQDNALIHAHTEDDHPWFEEFGRRVSAILNQAGIPYCRGGVMASERNLRHNLAGWQSQLDEWFARPEPRAILNADIFYDFTPAAGQFVLAADLRRAAARVKDARLFLNLMAKEIGDRSGALGWFGRFRTKKGRIDLKVGGLFPIVAGGRVLGLRLGSGSLSTRERWQEAFSSGIISEEDLARLLDAHEMILALILDQQLEDLGEGRPATAEVEVRRLLDLEQDRLKQALQIVGRIDLIVKYALGEPISEPKAASGPPGGKATRRARTKALPE